MSVGYLGVNFRKFWQKSGKVRQREGGGERTTAEGSSTSVLLGGDLLLPRDKEAEIFILEVSSVNG